MTEDIWVEKAEKWLWDSCGYAPDDSVKELAEWMEKAERYDAWMIDKTDGAIITIRQEKWQECLSALKKLEAVKIWHKAQVGRQVDPTDIKELGEILEPTEAAVLPVGLETLLEEMERIILTEPGIHFTHPMTETFYSIVRGAWAAAEEAGK